MSTYAITGNTGGGKSYMAAQLIDSEIKKGRVVVTNIPMKINSPNLREFSWDDIKDTSKPLVSGALYVIDEVWKEIPAGTMASNINLRIMHFFKEHRHYKDDRGRTIDIYLVTQNAGTDIASAIRDLIKQTFLCHEPMDLGVKDLRVRYYYSGAVKGVDPDEIRKKPIKTEQFKLNPEVYALYKSHTKEEASSVGEVQEQTGTATIFSGWKAKGWALGVSASVLLGIFSLYRIVYVVAPKYQKTSQEQLNEANGIATESPAVAQSTAGPVTVSTTTTTTEGAKPGESLRWRLVGVFEMRGQKWAYMTDKTGRARKLPIELCRDEWDTWICKYEGETVAMWTGPAPNDNSGQISGAVHAGASQALGG